jgi:hypothetical protein
MDFGRLKSAGCGRISIAALSVGIARELEAACNMPKSGTSLITDKFREQALSWRIWQLKLKPLNYWFSMPAT